MKLERFCSDIARSLVIVSASFLASPVHAQTGVYASGTADCGLWAKARSEKSAELLEHYILGILDGMALTRQVEFWRADGAPISRESVYLWMDGYCRENPLNVIITGAFVLYKERSGWQPE